MALAGHGARRACSLAATHTVERATRATLALASGIALAAPLALAARSRADGSARAAAAGAGALVHSAVNDANARGSVHVSETVRAATKAATSANDVAASEGQQVIHLSGATGEAQVALVSGTAYFTASEPMLVAYFGFPATVAVTIHGRWISVPQSNSAYAAIADGVTISSTLRELIPQGSLKPTGSSSVDGVAVTGIRGTVASTASSPAGTATVYVSRSAKPLPVRVDYSDSRGDTVTATFSRWGERIAIKAPTATIRSPASKRRGRCRGQGARRTRAGRGRDILNGSPRQLRGPRSCRGPLVRGLDPDRPRERNPYISTATGSATGYTVTATSASGDKFSIIRTRGVITRTCDPALERRLLARHLVAAAPRAVPRGLH